MTRGSRVIVLTLGSLGFLAACVPQGSPSPAVLAQNRELIAGTQPWTFARQRGFVRTTRSYRVFSTAEKTGLGVSLPVFLERALDHYTTAISPLPYPGRVLETYVLGDRGQWSELTREVLGDEAEPFLRIRRGGFAHRGRAVLYDIGPKDTYTIAAHEGWHQYVQRTFDEALPTWVDEGVATYMEGFRWESGEKNQPRFLPWANLERFGALRWARNTDRLLSLKELLVSQPSEMLSEHATSPLVYYAQVWALIHFLQQNPPEQGGAGLARLLHDAAHGRMARTVARSQGEGQTRRGLEVFRTYITPDLEAFEADFFAFIDQIVATGQRQHIAAGEAPVFAAPGVNPQ